MPAGAPPARLAPAAARPRVNDRLYPARPILAASVAVFRGGRVLIARRARAPLLGLYSLPGGGVEIGETLREAALRELAEEVGVTADIVAFVDHVEPIIRDNGRVREHYVIATFAARWRGGEPRTGAEADAVAWVDPEDIERWPTTPELPMIVAKAARLERGLP
jgi:ADP-ribose pyrophosphatase YjhB (NUDIX family)